MKILKYIGIILGVLIVLLLLGMVFLPEEAHVERSVTINAAPAAIFPEINDFQKFNSWSPWHGIDPDTEYTFEGPTAGEGSKMTWTSDHRDVGSGSQWIVESVPNEMVRSQLVFEGFDDPADAVFILEPTGDQTKVTWSFDSKMSGLYKYFGVMMDGMLGPMYETGLQNLKSVVEAKPTYSVDIGVEEVESISYLGILETVSIEETDQIGDKMGQLFGELMTYLSENNLQMTGAPMTVYPTWGEQQIEMECALPVGEEVETTGDRITFKATKAGPAIKALHLGDYQQLEATHQEVDRYAKDHGLSMAGSPYEIYITDPGQEPDTAKWITQVIYPVEK